MIGINEVAQKVIEKPQSSFDPSKRVSEVNSETKKTTYDPSKRVDTTSESNRENENKGLTDINGRDKISIDDNGKPYAENGELLPNAEYVLNGNRYVTDDRGRIIQVEGNLDLPRETTERPKLPDTPDRKKSDDRGHLVAREFGGSDEIGNLVSMDSEVNRNGDFRKLELELKQAIKDGSEVSIKTDVVYDGDSKRPSTFKVTYTIDGETYVKTIINDRKDV